MDICRVTNLECSKCQPCCGSRRVDSKPETHFITIAKDQFDKICIGDRIIIQNDTDKMCVALYVEEN